MLYNLFINALKKHFDKSFKQKSQDGMLLA